MTRTIEVLNAYGHLVLSWDPTLPESVERARGEFDALVQAGYQFFRVESDQAETGFSSAAGALVVKRVDAAEIAPAVQAEQPAGPERRRRGRPPKADRIVATRPMRGG